MKKLLLLSFLMLVSSTAIIVAADPAAADAADSDSDGYEYYTGLNHSDVHFNSTLPEIIEFMSDLTSILEKARQNLSTAAKGSGSHFKEGESGKTIIGLTTVKVTVDKDKHNDLNVELELCTNPDQKQDTSKSTAARRGVNAQTCGQLRSLIETKGRFLDRSELQATVVDVSLVTIARKKVKHKRVVKMTDR